MSLSVDYRDHEILAPPARGISVRMRLKWQHDPILLRDVRASLNLPYEANSARITYPVFAPGYPRVVPSQQEWDEIVEFPLTSDALRAIERARRPDVRFRLELKWAKGFLRSYTATGAVPYEALASVSNESRELIFDIPQSEWLKALKKLEWDQLDLIEVHRGALVESPELKEAFELLNGAQVAMWHHDFRKVAADCWGAFESLFRTFGENKTKAGADAVWEAVFPGDEPQQKLVNAFVKEFREYMQQYRHANAPLRRPSRAEAELFFNTTHSIFSLMSRRLAKQEA